MKKRFKIAYIFGLVATCLFTLSCSKDEGDQTVWYEQIYFNKTRGGETINTDIENRTYNFTLFPADGSIYSGTYRLPRSDEGRSMMFPCDVYHATGALTSTNGAFDSSKGLTAPAGEYQMVVVSPAVEVKDITDHLKDSLDLRLMTSK